MPYLNGQYHMPGAWLDSPVRIVVVGAGGSGSHVIANLAVLHQAMMAMGHPHGLEVRVYDHDEVSEANVGRAKFYPADVGSNKASVIVNRINLCFGLDWGDVPGAFHEGIRSEELTWPDIVIGCVDTRSSRRSIQAAMTRLGHYKEKLWLDLGNGEHDGQVVLGSTGKPDQRMPFVTELYPEMLEAKNDPKDAGPSCSMAEALRKQSAFVNATCAVHAVSMLANLFRTTRLDYSAIFFDISRARSTTLAASPDAWARFGWVPKVPKVRKSPARKPARAARAKSGAVA